MSDSTLVFANDEALGDELVVNFGVFSGREATAAEIDRLAQALLPEVESLEIVCEQRYEFSREGEASVYQIRIVLPGANGEALTDTVEAWARDCIAERNLLG